MIRRFIAPLALAAALSLVPPACAESAKADYYRGLDLYHAGDYEGAIAAFEAQLKATPDDTSARQWLELTRKRAAQAKGRPEAKPAPAAPPPPPPRPAAPAVAKTPAAPIPSSAGTAPAAAAARPSAAPAGSAAQDDYERGIALYLGGDYQASIESFNRYLEANPGHIATQQWIALVKALVPAETTGSKRVPTVVEDAPRRIETPPARKAEPPPPPPPARAVEKPEPLPARTEERIAPLPPEPPLPVRQAGVAPAAAPARDAAVAGEIAGLREARARLERDIEDLKAENDRLASDLRASQETAARAVEQTKRALALAPAAPSPEDAAALRKLEEENRGLRQYQDRLLEDLKKQKDSAAGVENALKAKAADAQRSLGELGSKLQAAENARGDAERRAAQLAQERKKLESEIAVLRTETQRLARDPEKESLRLGLKEARAALDDSERKLSSLLARYQAAEEGRAAAERKVAEGANLRATHKTLVENLAAKDGALRRAEEETARAQRLLEESRAQGLKLMVDLQKERERREEIEARTAQIAAREGETRAQLQSLRSQVDAALGAYDRGAAAAPEDGGAEDEPARKSGPRYDFVPSDR